MRSIILLCIYTVLLIGLAGCGAVSPVAQRAQTDHYVIQLDLDHTGLGHRTATITVMTPQNQPVSDGAVTLTPSMHDMGMIGQVISAQPIAPGRYQAQGELFSMLGHWGIDVQVNSALANESATFLVKATP